MEIGGECGENVFPGIDDVKGRRDGIRHSQKGHQRPAGRHGCQLGSGTAQVTLGFHWAKRPSGLCR